MVADFVAGLLKKAGLDKGPRSFRAEYAEKIKAEAQKRLGIVAIRELTPEAVDKFGELAGRGALPGEFAEFFKKNIPDYEKKAADALKKFADEFLSSAAELKAAK